jgi:hypothetical protein
MSGRYAPPSSGAVNSPPKIHPMRPPDTMGMPKTVETSPPPPVSPFKAKLKSPNLHIQLSMDEEPAPPMNSASHNPLGALKPRSRDKINPEDSLNEVKGDGPADLAIETCRLKKLGKGAGGTVYLGCYVPSLKLIALKEVLLHHEEDMHMLTQELHALHDNLVPLNEEYATQRSMRCLGKISHRKLHIGTVHACSHIVSFYGAFVTPSKSSVSIAMEYMDGGTLQVYIHIYMCMYMSLMILSSYYVLTASLLSTPSSRFLRLSCGAWRTAQCRLCITCTSTGARIA